MNASKLNEIARRTETSHRIIAFFAKRRRNTVYTAFAGLRSDLKKEGGGRPVDRAAMELTFKELEAVGAGKVIRTGGGTAKGFLWVQPVREIGIAMMKAEEAPAEVKPENGSKGPVGATLARTNATVVVIRKGHPTVTIERDEDDLKGLLN